MTTRRVFLRYGLAAAGVLLAACGQAATPAAAPKATEKPAEKAADKPAAPAPAGQAAPTKGAVKLTYWTWGDAKPTIAAFNEKRPEIQIDNVVMGPWDLHDKVLAAFASGAGAPDLTNLTSRRGERYTRGRGLLDITDRAAKYKENFPADAWAAVSRQGKVFGLPTGLGPGVLYYRRDVLEQNGIKVPIETWDDYIAAGTKVTQGDVFWMPMFYPSTNWGVAYYFMFLQGRSGNVFNEDGKTIAGNKLARETMRWYYDLAETQKIAMKIEFFKPEFWAAFANSKLITWPMNTSEGNNIRKNAQSLSGKWGILPQPTWSRDSKTAGVWGGSMIAATTQSKAPDQCYAYMEWLCVDLEGVVKVYQINPSFPAFKPALDDPRVNQGGDPFFGGDSTVRAAVQREYPVFRYVNEGETTNIIGRHIDAMFGGQKTPEQAWDDAEKEVAEKITP